MKRKKKVMARGVSRPKAKHKSSVYVSEKQEKPNSTPRIWLELLITTCNLAVAILKIHDFML